MKKLLFLWVALMISGLSFGQIAVTVTNPTNTTPNLAASYTSLANALTDLNLVTAMTGPVIFDLAANGTETAPVGGYLLGNATLNAVTSVTNTITFQKNGAGANPLITAYAGGVGTPGTAVQDGIWRLVGIDYVTIDGIDLTDPNLANPATMEYGYGLYKASVTDGCQYNTIKNCTVTLNRLNWASGTAPAVDGSRAINVMNALATAQTTVVTPTLASGTNSYNKFYSNTLQNCNIGIALIGYAGVSPFTLCDFGNDIGGSSIATGNNIINYGGGAVATNASAGVRTLAQYDLNVSYNTINNNNGAGVNHVSTLRGIYLNTAVSASATISYNTLSISSGATTSQVSVIENVSGSTAAGNTININNNTINNCNWATATSGTFYGIYNNGASPANLNINNNSFASITRPGTGAANLIYVTGTIGTAQNINNNTYTNLSLATTGSVYFIYNSNATNNMTISNNAISGTFAKTGAGGSVYGYYNFGSPTGGTATLNGNNFSNISLTGATTFYGIDHRTSITQILVYTNNTISNITGGSSSLYGIYQGYGAAGSTVNGNTISSWTGSGAMYGLYLGTSAPTSLTTYNNIVNGLNTSGAVSAYGIYNNLGTLNSIYKNKVYDLQANNATGTAYGIYLSGGTTTNVYNNFISDIRTPLANAANPLAGIYIAGGTTANIFYNTVYLNATSAGALFGSSALYASTTPTVDIRNNVLVNVSTPNGAGITAAYRRSSTTLTSYSANSNANAFYAGASEDATHAVYYDGTTPYAYAAYQTLVGPSRDAVSFRELPPFLNVATTPYDLHMNTAIATYCESGGLAVSSPISITDDFDGNARNSTPDVGADEFAGIAAGVINPSLAASVASSQQINLTFTTNPSVNNVVIVWNATGTFSAPSGPPPAPGNAFAGGTLIYNGTSSPFNHTGLTAATAYYYKAFSYDGANYSSGVTANATTNITAPTAFTATPTSSSQINLAYTKNAAGNDVIIATNSTVTFGSPVNGVALNVSDPITGGGTVIYKGPLAAFNHTSLTPNTAYYYKIWSVDAYDYYSTTGVTANATTLCSAITSYPWNEGFEGLGAVGTNVLPSCWAYSNIISTNYSCNATCNSNTAHTGTKFIGGSWNFDVWDFTPGMQLNAGTSYDFSYWFKCTDATVGYNVSLAYGADQNAASMTNVLNSETGLNIASWTLRTFSFTPASSGIYYFGLHNVCPTSAPNGIAFDDFTLDLTPSCVTPTAVTATAITTTTATISWTAAAPAPANGYEYEVRTSGAAGSGATGLTLSGSTVAGDVNDNITGLSANTTYYVYVRSNCGGSLYSTWTSAYNFTTPCTNTSLPVSEGFNSTSIPSCWTQQYVAGTYNIQYLASSTNPSTTPQEGADYVYWNAYNITAGNETRLVSAPITTTGINSVDVNFYWMNENSTSYNSGAYLNEGVTVQYSTDGSSWNDVQFFARYDATLASGVAQWKLKNITLPAGAGNQAIVYIGFKFHSEFGDNCSMDNVVINATPAGMWAGTVSSDWGTTGNWTSGTLPTSGDNVVISAGAPNMPVVNAVPATPATCNALTIAPTASLTIAAGKALTASGATTNNGTFTIASDATGVGSFIDNGTIGGTGTFTVQNYLTGSGGATPNGRYWYIGSPVTGALSGVFNAMGDNKLWYFDEVAGNYSEVITNGISLNVMQGFVARLGATETINFTGALNTGDKAYPLTATSPNFYEGFNLVSNPFPSAVNLLTVSTPPTNLENTVWYRSGTTFATYNYQTTASTNGGTEFVPSMQSFWVKVTTGQTTGSVTLNQGARVHSTQAYYKTTSESNLFRMTVSDGISNDETVIGFYQDAQNTFENYDSRKMISEDAPQLYSLSTDLAKVAINGQTEMTVNEERIVSLGFKTNVAGTFTINATNLSDFDANVDVYLEDAQLGILQDLRLTSTYSFASSVIDDVNRFKVHFGNLITSIPTITESAISAYAVNNNLYVNTPKTATIKVYDVLGNLIMNQQSAQGLNILQMNVETGIYFVNIQTGTQVTTQKVMISK